MAYVIGIDVGSSATKAGLFSLDGRAIAATSREYPTEEPQPGWKEQDPERWWVAAADAIREISADVPPESITALGAAGHISSFTFVDGMGRPLRPAIGFQDQRAIEELHALYARFSREELAAELGIDLPPAATWPLPRLLWFRDHEPRTLAQARYLLQAKDFLNLRLTGEFASDPSSSRGMVEFPAGRPARKVFCALGLDPALLPPLRGPEEIVGRITAEAAVATGLRPALPVVCGWNDLNACVLGTGAVNAGDAFNITGTSEHAGVVTDRDYRNPSLVCAPFLNGKKLLYGVTSCGGGSLEWYRRASRRPLEELLALAESAPAGADSLLFLPYLEGERAPVWDARASGAFIGLRTRHTEGHLVRAVLEGVALGLRQILDLVDRETGRADGDLVIAGGAARVRLWNQIKADVFGRTVARLANPHAGVLGAAMLAAVAAGCFGTCEEAARAMVRREEHFTPSPPAVARYESLLKIYANLYPALQSAFARLHEDRSRELASVRETYV